MKNWKKIAKFAGITLASVTLLAACGNEEDAATGEEEITDEEVNLEVWLTPQWQGVYSPSEEGADYDSFFAEAADLYTEEHPNVNIDVQVIPSDQRDSNLSVGLETDSLPNVFFDSTFVLSTWAHQGIALPFDDVISDESKDDISKEVWENVTIEDSVYYYPFAQNQGTLVYNADMFEEAGLEDYITGEDEIASWTTDEFEEILTALQETNDDVAPLGFFSMDDQGDTWNMMYLRSFGNEFYGDDGRLVVNEPSGVEAVEWIDNMNQDGLLVQGAESLTSNEVNAMFQNKEVAVSFTNTILYNNMLSDMENDVIDPFDARLANVPAAEGEDHPVFTYVLGSIVMDTLDEAENEVAKDFVKFYSEHEELTNASVNTLPIRSSVSEEFSDELPLLSAYEENEKNIVDFSNNIAGYAELRNVFFPEIQSVLTGTKTPQEAMDDLEENGNEIIDRGNEQSLIINN
jgi:multiple sugar transport system substrate-binding protein